MTEPRQVRWFNHLELLIIAIGIALRIVRFAQPRPLWLDEVMIALNLRTKWPHELLFPLGYNQISPPGFLLGEWLVAQLGGTGEKALRFLPLVAGIAALVLFARLARRILEPGTALLATALAALSPLLIYYSAEVKSYGFDWLGAVLVMHATLTVLEGASRQVWVRWGLAATFGALVSTPAPFIVAGCALALLAAPAVRRGQRSLIYLVAAGTPAALIAVLHLLMVHRLSRTTSFMQVFWTESFLQPSVPHALKLAREFFGAVLFGVAVSESLPRLAMTIVVAISIIGTIALGRRSLPTAALLLAPVLLVAAASLGRWWPLAPRLLLFAVPAVLITVPAGLAAMARRAPRKVEYAVLAALSTAIVVAAVAGVPGEMRVQPRFRAVPEVLRDVGARHAPNAVLYVSSDLAPACEYYLRFHPDRSELPADSLLWGCGLRGTRTISGGWPTFVGLPPGLATRAAKTIDPGWLESEGRRVLDPTATEIWVLLGSVPELRTALPQWLEAAGATRRADREMGGIRILTYQPD